MKNLQKPLEQRILSYILDQNMIRPGDRVLVGVSGGADSVCLLLMLKELAGTLGCSVAAATIHHGIRGEEADEDVRFTEELCRTQGIPLTIRYVTVPEYAAEHGLSEETAARLMRYEALSQIVEEGAFDSLACAHHRNDQTETVLHHLFRGSSLKGLSGMAPERSLKRQSDMAPERSLKRQSDMAPERSLKGQSDTAPERSLKGQSGITQEESFADTGGCRLIRPLLCVSRQEIEDWLLEKKQSFRTDSTNLEETYTRNYIRRTLIPAIETHVNPEAGRHIALAAEDIREAQQLITDLAYDWIRENAQTADWIRENAQMADWIRENAQMADCSKENDPAPDRNIEIPVASFLALRPVLQREILMQCLEYLLPSGHATDVGRMHLNRMIALCRGENGKWMPLPGGLKAQYEYGILRLSVPEKQAIGKDCENTVKQAVGEEWEGTKKQDADGSRVFSVQVCARDLKNTESEAPMVFVETEDASLLQGLHFAMTDHVAEKELFNPYTKYLNCDIIKGKLCVRTRRKGDYFLLENGGRKSVKSYMIDRKIPAKERDRMPLLADGSHVWWMADGRISSACRVNAETKRILIIDLIGGQGEL